MFFDEGEDDDRWINQDLFHFISNEILAMGSPISHRHNIEFHHADSSSYGSRNAPTHTEDGIPIRKLYVSNLPPKTNRAELFGVFAQYGFIKSCWLRMGEKGPNRSPRPTYAFVTYSNPDDAHKALQAPCHEKMLRGRNLRISPADSWHQPAQDADGRVRWRHTPAHRAAHGNTAEAETTSENGDGDGETTPEHEVAEESQETGENEEVSYSILDVLNGDCLSHILSYVPITDLIQSERVSKGWQSMVENYLQGLRTFKTSWWSGPPASLTTAVLRRLLQRVTSLTRLHIDHPWSALNDRTAHTIGKFCPNLEELKVIDMHTKNWNPLTYGCKQLKSLSFVSCNKLTDSSLIQIVKNDSSIERLAVANNTHVTGLFLTGSNPPNLNALSFYNCYSLQGTVLCAAIESLPNLTTLQLDVCPITRTIPMILKKLPRLEELSLCEYSLESNYITPDTDEFCESFATLTELKVLNLFKNIYVTNAVMKQIAQTCTKLEVLNVSGCSSQKPELGVGNEGVSAVCVSCRALRRLDVSYLGALSDAGAPLARLPRLAALTARGCPALTAAPLAAALAACPRLQEVDVCGCEGVSEAVAAAAVAALQQHPRHITLYLGGTAAADETLPTHKLLTVDLSEERCNTHLRPDFVDGMFSDEDEDEDEDDMFEDVYQHFEDDLDEYYIAEHDDDDIIEEMLGYNYAIGMHEDNIILL